MNNISQKKENSQLSTLLIPSTLSDYNNFLSNYRDQGLPSSPNGVVNYFLCHLFGCVMSERDEIREKKQIPQLFFSRLKTRLERKEDTGLLPEKGLDIYYSFSEEDRAIILNELRKSVESIHKMAHLEKMIVLGTLDTQEVIFQGEKISLVLPAIVQSNSGKVVICPIWTPENDTENTLLADIMELVENDSFGREIVSAHVWDLRNKKIVQSSLDPEINIKLR